MGGPARELEAVEWCASFRWARHPLLCFRQWRRREQHIRPGQRTSYTPPTIPYPIPHPIPNAMSTLDDEEYVRSSGLVAAPMAQADFILARGLFTMLGAGVVCYLLAALRTGSRLLTA
mgnify:CR=1 FL=1